MKTFKILFILFSALNVLALNFVVQFKRDMSFNSFFGKYYNTSGVNPEILETLGLKAYEIGDYRGVFGEFSPELIKYFDNDNEISEISIDKDLVLAEIQEHAPKHLARLSQSTRLEAKENLNFIYSPVGGIGVDVYILDSGIEASTSEFGTRVMKIADFTGEPLKFKDLIGHGTHIAGVIASNTYGVAKKANLFDVKVTNKQGKTKLSAVLSALSMILTDSKATKRPTIVVIPLIMKKNFLLNGAVETLVEQGIPVIVPAGNDAKLACNYSPGSAKGSLTVGSINSETDSIAPFSNWGTCVDIFAPGVDIETTSNIHNKTTLKSGTSLSAGLAAGMVASFMGMGDDGQQAIQRIINYSTKGAIQEQSIKERPLTVNRLLFNGEIESR